MVDLASGPVDHGGVSADRRPSYEELAAENTELRATVSDLRSVVVALGAEVAQLKRRLGQHSRNSSRPPSSDSPFTNYIEPCLPEREIDDLRSAVLAKVFGEQEMALAVLMKVQRRKGEDTSRGRSRYFLGRQELPGLLKNFNDRKLSIPLGPMGVH